MQKHSLPHKTIVRSIKLNNEGKIFVGAQDEIGYFFPDENGSLNCHSLRNLNSEPESNTDLSYVKETFNEVINSREQVWSLHKINRNILMGHEDAAYVVEGNYAGTYLGLSSIA